MASNFRKEPEDNQVNKKDMESLFSQFDSILQGPVEMEEPAGASIVGESLLNSRRPYVPLMIDNKLNRIELMNSYVLPSPALQTLTASAETVYSIIVEHHKLHLDLEEINLSKESVSTLLEKLKRSQEYVRYFAPSLHHEIIGHPMFSEGRSTDIHSISESSILDKPKIDISKLTSDLYRYEYILKVFLEIVKSKSSEERASAQERIQRALNFLRETSEQLFKVIYGKFRHIEGTVRNKSHEEQVTVIKKELQLINEAYKESDKYSIAHREILFYAIIGSLIEALEIDLNVTENKLKKLVPEFYALSISS